MCPINIVVEPAMLTISTSCFLNSRDKKAAQEAPYSKDTVAEGETDTP